MLLSSRDFDLVDKNKIIIDDLLLNKEAFINKTVQNNIENELSLDDQKNEIKEIFKSLMALTNKLDKNLDAFIEQDAPLNGGEEVTFTAYSFTIDLPHVDDKASPRAVITIDNVSREIIENIERAVESQEVIKVTYRPYLSNDLSTPQHNPPLHLVLSDIEANVHKITAKASFGDLANKAFPNDTYTPSRFPGLGR